MRAVPLFPDDSYTAAPAAEPRYIALRASQICPEDLQTLTPRLMQWEADLWLLDLKPCISYWRLLAQRQHKSLLGVLQEILETLPEGPYTAALSAYPWQAILLTQVLEQKGFRGLNTESQRLSRNLMSSLSWDLWWAAAERYAFHSQETKTFFKHKRAMQIAMRRLCCDRPTSLKTMPSFQIKRRFGPLIAALWEQTFPSHETSPSSGSLEETAVFPWQSYVLTEPLTHTRHLDFPLSDWQSLEAFLREDLNRLCLLDSFKKGERILNLEWMIVLDNLQEISLSVLFRHPHCLQSESPHQRTALLQISYAFQRAQQASRRKLANESPWIVSWRLRVLESLRPLAAPRQLFDESSASWNELLNLENQLDRPLEAYQVVEDWLPEDAFTSLYTPAAFERERLPALEHLGRERPLFLLQQPQPWNPHGQNVWSFKERTMDKWWRHQNRTTRDYYQVVSRDQKQVLWVFRDDKGQCFVHGIYA